MRTALLVVICADTVLAVAFPLLYGLLARGWRATPLGRHFMSYTSLMAGLMLLTVSSFAWRTPRWVWLAGYVALGVLLAHRIWLLVAIQWRTRHADDPEER